MHRLDSRRRLHSLSKAALPWWGFAATCLLALTMAGCGYPEAIQTYKIDKEEVATSQQVSNKRMLAAILPQGDELWFFKMMDDDRRVIPEMETFVRLVQSVKFDELGEPSWTNPEGWETKPGGSLRFATVVKTDSPLELTISKLANQANQDEFILMNVNRWRGQVSLPPIDLATMKKDAIEVETVSNPELKALVFNLAGTAPSRGGGPPMMGGMRQPPATTRSDEVKFELPTGWQQSSNDSLSMFAFAVGEGADASKVTITKMAVIPNLVRLNMNRWRGQVGLPDLTPEQMDSELVQLKFAEGTASYLKMPGEERSVLGVIADRRGEAWFIKMIGPTEAVADQEAGFRSFVESIRIGANQ